MALAQFMASIDEQDGGTAYLVQSPTAAVVLHNEALNELGAHMHVATDGDETWVAVGSGGVGGSLSTDDGVTFADIADLAGLSLTALIWDGARFVAVSSSRAYWSFNGTDWEAGQADGVNGGVGAASGLAFFAGSYVTMVASTNRVRYTADLNAAWSNGQQIVALNAHEPFRFACSDTLIVLTASTNEEAYWATDPTSISGWTAGSFSGAAYGGAPEEIYMLGVVWDGTNWLAGGSRIGGGGQMGYHTSTDGKAWARATNAGATTLQVYAVSWDGADYWTTGWDTAGTDDRAIFQFDGAVWTRTSYNQNAGSTAAPGQCGIAVAPNPFLPSGVWGHVYYDPALDGTFSGGPASGVSLSIYDGVTLVGTVVTGADGVWQFGGLDQTGTAYQVRLTAPAGYNPTIAQVYDFTTAADVNTFDFGVAAFVTGIVSVFGEDVQPPVYAEAAGIVNVVAEDAFHIAQVEGPAVVNVFAEDAFPYLIRVAIVEESIVVGG